MTPAGNAKQESKDELINAILKVLRVNPYFSKIDEKNVKKIFKKLEINDLIYLANIFDSLAEWLAENLPPRDTEHS